MWGAQYFPPSGRSFNDVPLIKYKGAPTGDGGYIPTLPYQNEYCPPLDPGAAPDGAHAPRLVTGRWYTLEERIKLAPDNTGILEMWVDGIKAYSSQRITCSTGCPDLGYILLMAWVNDIPKDGYVEYDNLVMSRKYIGPPAGSVSSDKMPPAKPRGLRLR